MVVLRGPPITIHDPGAALRLLLSTDVFVCDELGTSMLCVLIWDEEYCNARCRLGLTCSPGVVACIRYNFFVQEDKDLDTYFEIVLCTLSRTSSSLSRTDIVSLSLVHF